MKLCDYTETVSRGINFFMTLTKIFINSFLLFCLAAWVGANGNLSKEYQDWNIVPQVILFPHLIPR
jgi:hypothetical protein